MLFSAMTILRDGEDKINMRALQRGQSSLPMLKHAKLAPTTHDSQEDLEQTEY